MATNLLQYSCLKNTMCDFLKIALSTCNWHCKKKKKRHGHRSLVGYSPWGRKELDTTERIIQHPGRGSGNPL